MMSLHFPCTFEDQEVVSTLTYLTYPNVEVQVRTIANMV
jgi:hypothetical protein